VIPDASTMDKPLGRARPGGRRRAMLLGGAAVALLAAAALVTPGLRRWSRAERVVDASRVRVAAVARGDLERDVAVQGRVVAALHPTLFSPASGIVTLQVKAGADVKQGQVLARVDSPELTSRLVQEQATLASLDSELARSRIAARQAGVKAKQAVDLLSLKREAAERTLKRERSLHERGMQSPVELEKADDDARIAAVELENARETAILERDTYAFEERTRRLQLDRQRAVVEDLQRQVAELTLRAPFDGLVATMAVQDRDAVARNQAVLSVVNLSEFEIELELPENHASDVVPRTPVEINYQGRLHPGKVLAVSPEVRDSQVRATVAFDGNPPAGLRQSERVTARVILERRAGVLKLPRGPFLEAGGGRSAYVVDSGVAVKRPIQTGAVSVTAVEVLGGLRPGDQVVVSDTSLFEDARTVLIRP
jgi:HlyD family secretion protein